MKEGDQTSFRNLSYLSSCEYDNGQKQTRKKFEKIRDTDTILLKGQKNCLNNGNLDHRK